jgi:hypothetical protein
MHASLSEGRGPIRWMHACAPANKGGLVMLNRSELSRAVAASVVLAAGGSAFGGGVIGVNKILAVGDTLGGRAVTGVGQPFTNSLGQVGFVALHAGDSTRSIYLGNGSVFNSSSQPTWTGSEDTMGISDAGDYIYSPSVSSNDAVVTSSGVLLKGTDPLPFDPTRFSTFNSRPRMTANGTAVWVGGSATTAGGTTTARALMRNPSPSNPAATVSLLKGGDVVSGVTVAAAGINFAYDIADNGTNYINDTTLVSGTADDRAIVVNGTIAMREGGATGQGDLWQNWKFMGINNSGNFTVCGDTNSTTDDFVTFNSTIAVRQGQVVDGLTLGATVDMVSINNNNNIAMIWDVVGATGAEALFYGPGSNLLAGSTALLRTGDLLDFNGDNDADVILTDFTASATIAPGLDIADNGVIYVNVSVTPIAGGAAFEAVIAIPAPGAVSVLGLAGVVAMRRRRA